VDSAGTDLAAGTSAANTEGAMNPAATIPSDGISYEEAFERFFDTRPDAAALRAELDRTSVVEDEAELLADRPDHDAAWLRADQAWQESQQSFREALACGALPAYQRDPATGERLKLPPSHWMRSAEGPDWADEPSVFFLKADIDRWLGKSVKSTNGLRATPDRERARRALDGCFPDMFGLQQPRHISTLPIASFRVRSHLDRFTPINGHVRE